MFRKDIKRIPTVSRVLEEEYFPEDKNGTSRIPTEYKKLSWDELGYHGVISEEKDQNEDFTIITKKFMAYDRSHWRTQTFCISTEVYRHFMTFSKTDEVENEIADLELSIEIYEGNGMPEGTLKELKDQIAFLKAEFNIK